MNTFQLVITIAAFIFSIIFLSGFWLHKTGKPYNPIVFTLHKLVSLSIIVYTAAKCFQLYKIGIIDSLGLVVCLTTLLLFLSTVITGAVMSAAKSTLSFIQIIHKMSSVISLFFTGLLIYLLRAHLYL